MTASAASAWLSARVSVNVKVAASPIGRRSQSTEDVRLRLLRALS